MRLPYLPFPLFKDQTKASTTPGYYFTVPAVVVGRFVANCFRLIFFRATLIKVENTHFLPPFFSLLLRRVQHPSTPAAAAVAAF